MKTVYLAGKVTGLDTEETRQNFDKCEKWLIGQGYEVVNPMRIVPSGTPWNKAMGMCIESLLGCDCVYLMPNWRQSKGANLEFHVAKIVGKEILNQ